MYRALVAVFIVSFPTAAALAACLHYDVPDIVLQGHIYSYEPPSSSSSSTVHVGYFVTTRPICLRGDENNLAAKDVRRFSYVMASGNHQDIASYKRQLVAVTGHFLPTYIPHYHPVPIFVVVSVQGRHAAGP